MPISHFYFAVQFSKLLSIYFFLCWWPCCLIYWLNWSHQKRTSTTIYIYLTFSICRHIVCLATCHHRWTFYLLILAFVYEVLSSLHTQGHAVIIFSPPAVTSSIQLVSFYKTFSWPYLPCQLLLFLLSFETKHFPVILFTFITSHFSLLTFSHKLTQARLPSHHSIKTVITVTRDHLAAKSHGQLSVLVLIDLSATFDSIDHSVRFEMHPPPPPNIDLFFLLCVWTAWQEIHFFKIAGTIYYLQFLGNDWNILVKLLVKAWIMKGDIQV